MSDSRNDSKKDELLYDHNHDGINRRGFLKCMAWAGTGTLCVMQGGVLKSFAMNRLPDPKSAAAAGELSFVQISDSHMGFNKAANPDVAATLQAAVDKIKAAPAAPEFLLHTGDVSHLSRPDEFDAVDQMLKSTGKEMFFVPGEHDVLEDDGKQYLERYGKGTKGAGWYSFDKKGVHFVGPGERDEPESWRTRNARPRSTGMAGTRREASEGEHTDRCLRAHSAVDSVSGLGMGHGRQRAGARIFEEVRFGFRVERTHPSGDAESRRQRDVSHRGFDGVPTTCAGTGAFAGTDESACGTTAKLSRNHVGELRARTARTRHRRFKT